MYEWTWHYERNILFCGGCWEAIVMETGFFSKQYAKRRAKALKIQHTQLATEYEKLVKSLPYPM